MQCKVLTCEYTIIFTFILSYLGRLDSYLLLKETIAYCQFTEHKTEGNESVADPGFSTRSANPCLSLCQIFPEKRSKMKEFGPRGARPRYPFLDRPLNGNTKNETYFLQCYITWLCNAQVTDVITSRRPINCTLKTDFIRVSLLLLIDLQLFCKFMWNVGIFLFHTQT